MYLLGLTGADSRVKSNVLFLNGVLNSESKSFKFIEDGSDIWEELKILFLFDMFDMFGLESKVDYLDRFSILSECKVDWE